MENLQQDTTYVVVNFDDILVRGRHGGDNLKILQVLLRLQEAGLKLKLEKCTYLVPEVEYLGHVIETGGLNPT